jgi:hypothetical protein
VRQRIDLARLREWLQRIGVSADLDALRARLCQMTVDELLKFGKQRRDLVYPLR